MQEYEPDTTDTFITVKSGEYQRLIWSEPLELREREEDFWEQFMEFIQENSLQDLPTYYTSKERIGLRFLQGTGWKNQVAYDEIIAHN